MNAKNDIKAVLDTNVIHPVLIRDILLWLMHHEVFAGYWSDIILEEWKVLLKKIYVHESIPLERIEQIKSAFPESLVTLKNKTAQFNIPDRRDAHVIQLAIEVKARWIITFNMKDFPQKTLSTFDIIAITPDEFISLIIQTRPNLARIALIDLIKIKRNPPLSTEQFLNRLKDNNLKQTFAACKNLL